MKRMIQTVVMGLLLAAMGCAKAGPAAVKAVMKGEQQMAVKAAGHAEHQIAAKIAPSMVPKVTPVVRDASKVDWAGRVDDARDVVDAIYPSEGAGRFPFPASTVVAITSTPDLVDSSTGAYNLRNNYGGYNIYDRFGRPLGFSALHKPTGEIHMFDTQGYPVR